MIYNVRMLPSGAIRVVVSSGTRTWYRDFSSSWSANVYVWWLRVRHGAHSRY